jgi:hypothetical protein
MALSPLTVAELRAKVAQLELRVAQLSDRIPGRYQGAQYAQRKRIAQSAAEYRALLAYAENEKTPAPKNPLGLT